MFDSREKMQDWLRLGVLIEEAGGVPCEQAPELYFPERTETGQYEKAGELALTNMAKRACLDCPIMVQCGEYAVKWNMSNGIWGGTSPNDRRKLRRRAGLTNKAIGGKRKRVVDGKD